MATKNLCTILIIFALTLGFVPVAQATDIQIGDQVVILPADQQPITTETNTYIPVRTTFEALDYDVNYDAQMGYLVLTNPDTAVYFPMAAKGYVVNNRLMAAFSPLLIQENKIYVDIKDAGWILGGGEYYVSISTF